MSQEMPILWAFLALSMFGEYNLLQKNRTPS